MSIRGDINIKADTRHKLIIKPLYMILRPFLLDPNPITAVYSRGPHKAMVLGCTARPLSINGVSFKAGTQEGSLSISLLKPEWVDRETLAEHNYVL